MVDHTDDERLRSSTRKPCSGVSCFFKLVSVSQRGGIKDPDLVNLEVSTAGAHKQTQVKRARLHHDFNPILKSL